MVHFSISIETAVANQSGAMEADTISKNWACSKSLMSRKNFLKKYVLNMKAMIIMILLWVCTVKLNAQGMNNDFAYDEVDFNMIFGELGIRTFKFPIKQNTNQIFDIIIEEYEDKTLINSISLIDDTKKQLEKYGINADSNFKPRKDSIYFYRSYFIEKDSIITIKLNTIGIQTQYKFSLSGKSTFSVNANTFDKFKSEGNVKYLDVDKPEILVYLYANSSNEKDKPLWCSTGLSKERLLESFYYFIFVSIEPYKENKER